MKNDWPIKKLGEVADYINGYPFSPKEWNVNGLPIIRIQNLNDSTKGYNYFQGNIDKKYLVNTNDILISWSASLGVYIWSKNSAWLNQHIFKVIINEKKIDKDFFFYLAQTKVEEMKSQVHGGTMKHITKDKFEKINISVPPIIVQKKIVEKLDAIGKAQESIDLHIRKTEELFESLLENEINSRGAKGQLSDFTKLITYGFTNPMPVVESGPFMITARDINDGEVKYKTCRKTSLEAYKQLSNKAKPELEDILLTKDGTLGRMALVTEIPLCINQSVALIKPDKNKIMPKFLKYLLESSHYQKEILRNAGGATIKHIYITIVDKMEISVPDIEKQKEVVRKLDAIQEYKKLLQKQKLLYKELFDSVLDKSMKGDLD